MRQKQVVVADIGGTHARLAVATLRAEHAITLSAFDKLHCSDFASISELLHRYFALHTEARLLDCVIAIAAPIVNGDVAAQANLPWLVRHQQLQTDFPSQAITLLNDFVALAHAVPTINDGSTCVLSGPAVTTPAPTLVIGPGTGFGAAIWLPGTPSTVLPSEAGHAALVASTDLEIEILRGLKRRWQHVDVERILSGPGLKNCYQILCELKGQTPQLYSPAEIAHAAMQQQDPLTERCLSIFCGWMGSVAGDLSIIVGAQRVILAGGIPTQILPFLLNSDFATRFTDKGVMTKIVEQITVQVIEHGQLALLGAAQWYLEHHD